MKNVYLIFATLLFSIGLMTCSDDSGDFSFDVLDTEVYFKARGGETYLDVRTTEKPTITIDEAWIKAWLNEDDKTLIMVSADSYDGATERRGEIKITSGKVTKTVSVIQSAGILEVVGENVIKTSISQGGEYNYEIKNTFNESLIFLKLKNEADKEWIDASLTSNTKIKVNVKPGLQKPKQAIIYLAVNRDSGIGIMDSLIINSNYYAYDDILNTKWIASFQNRNGDTFSENVEILKNDQEKLVIKGISINENSNQPLEIPVNWSNTEPSFAITIPFTGNYIHKENDEKYIFLSGITSNGSMWAVGGGPSSYEGRFSVDEENQGIIVFPRFNYGSYPIVGFAFRAYKTPNAGSNLGSQRYVLDLILTAIP